MTNKEIFFQEYSSEVYLEETNHVYIHKQTNIIYPSVTGVLESVKEKLDAERIIPAMIKQFEDFKMWFYERSNNDKAFLELLEKFLKFKDKRDYKLAQWENRTYKKYKKITEYLTIEELEYELDKISEDVDGSKIFKKIYLKNDGTIMDAEDIENVWEAIKELANYYGSLIHLVLEHFLLQIQNIEIREDLAAISLFNTLNRQIIYYSQKYKYCAHIFKNYVLKDFNEFKTFIIDAFLAIGHDFGKKIYIPEKVMYYPKFYLCGMSDMLILDKPEFKFFDIGDHKTNVNFKFENEYDKFLLPPFSHIEETDTNIYNFQISIYSIMYENMTGRSGKDFWISYFDTKNQKFQKVYLDLFKEEARELLDIHKNNFEKNLTLYRKSNIFAQVSEKYHYYLTYRLSKDIAYKKEKGLLSPDKDVNRTFYEKMIHDIVFNIEKEL